MFVGFCYGADIRFDFLRTALVGYNGSVGVSIFNLLKTDCRLALSDSWGDMGLSWRPSRAEQTHLPAWTLRIGSERLNMVKGGGFG